jgi:hypothetical protein
MSKPPIRMRELRAKKAGSRLLLKVFLLFQHIDNIAVELISLPIGDLEWIKNRHGRSGIPDISYKGFWVFQFRCVYERHLRIYHITPRGMTPAALCLEYLPADLILFRGRLTLARIDELCTEIAQPDNREETKGVDYQEASGTFSSPPAKKKRDHEKKEKYPGEGKLHFDWEQPRTFEQMLPVREAEEHHRKPEEERKSDAMASRTRQRLLSK